MGAGSAPVYYRWHGTMRVVVLGHRLTFVSTREELRKQLKAAPRRHLSCLPMTGRPREAGVGGSHKAYAPLGCVLLPQTESSSDLDSIKMLLNSDMSKVGLESAVSAAFALKQRRLALEFTEYNTNRTARSNTVNSSKMTKMFSHLEILFGITNDI